MKKLLFILVLFSLIISGCTQVPVEDDENDVKIDDKEDNNDNNDQVVAYSSCQDWAEAMIPESLELDAVDSKRVKLAVSEQLSSNVYLVSNNVWKDGTEIVLNGGGVFTQGSGFKNTVPDKYYMSRGESLLYVGEDVPSIDEEGRPTSKQNGFKMLNMDVKELDDGKYEVTAFSVEACDYFV